MTDIILDSITDGVFTVDLHWRITFFNKAAERITGVLRSDAIGRLCHEVFKSNMCENGCPLRKTLKNDKPIVDRKGYCLNVTGERVPISVSTAILSAKDGTVVGGAETFRDLREIEELRERLNANGGAARLMSRNPSMQKILDLLPAVARSNSTVLLEGETGTGKEVLAREIHRLSDRADGPFIAVNCGALPDNLLESELFGYRKGAFTGADRDKAGRFGLAENGTLFLDEIGDLPLSVQGKLLRVLQEREYEALGATATEKTNARVLCAANRDLKEEVERGSFRSDLFYRVNVVSIALPPLRSRVEDIPSLADGFLRVFAQRMKKPLVGFTGDAYAALYAYRWPGNIRELENVVERAVVLCEGIEIDSSLFPVELRHEGPERSPDGGGGYERQSAFSSFKKDDMRSAKREVERNSIIFALNRNDGRCQGAAEELGVDKATLYRKIKALGIDAKKGRRSS